MPKNMINIIDIHNHSLPKIDDGAKDNDMSIEMLKVAVDSGTSQIVLTPHHLNGAFNNFRDSIVEDTSKLQALANEQEIPIKLHYGTEIHLVPETVPQIIENKALTYCGLGKAALIELPKNSIPSGTESILSKLIYNGITPIIAHPERNSSLRRDHTQFIEWIEFGCKSQVTGQSCTGGFGSSLEEFSFELISKNLVHFIASDAHRPTGRSPNLKDALATITENFGEQAAQTLFHDNPLRLINGEDIISLNLKVKSKPAKKRKGWLSFLK